MRQRSTIKELQKENEEIKQKMELLLISKEEEEKEKGNGGKFDGDKAIRNDILFLDSKITQFIENYDKNKINDIFKESPDSLLVSAEIDGLQITTNSIGKHLNDLKAHISNVMIPDIH